MRRPRLGIALAAGGIAAGLAIEWISYDAAVGVGLTAADFAVGCILLTSGVVAHDRRPESRVGPIMWLGGATWFLGTAFAPLLYLHRGPLVHLHLTYPSGRVRSLLVTAVVGAAYVLAAVPPLARDARFTLVLAVAVALAAVHAFASASGTARKAGGTALAAALAYAALLGLLAVDSLAGWSLGRTVVWLTYDTVIGVVVIVLLVDFVRGRWAEAVVTGLVVDLGASDEAGTLRAKLAGALGDPSLAVAYRVSQTDGYVDETGRPVELSNGDESRTVTPLVDHGEQIAVLVHDGELSTDAGLVEAVASAARIAVANAALQAEGRATERELEASRLRIVEAADSQRRRIQHGLQDGAGERLARVAVLLAEARSGLASGDATALGTLEADLVAARSELEELARGVMPGQLIHEGPTTAIAQLARRSPVAVELRGCVGRLSEPVEAALYFVCSEALANVAKHASASRVVIELREEAGYVRAVVEDDGAGGADLDAGSGLRGLADRIEALGGRLTLVSPPGAGTRLEAALPLERPSPRA